ncbi:MAG: MerR family transcriptional regulator [Lachnospiraceae bacterium]|jgi:DNA-binding transcriptional MerR regulator
MEKYRAIPQGYMTVGEVAKKMGVTIRTLQYYDREGLLSPSAKSEGGRRLYTDKDLVILHQILSLKSLGFSLDDIKQRLSSLETPDDVANALNEQAENIRSQIGQLQASLTAIEQLKAEVLKMQTVNFKKYADIIVNLQMHNNFYPLIRRFDDDTLDHIRSQFDKKSSQDFIDRFSRISDEIIKLKNENVPPESEKGQQVIKEYWGLIQEFTNGDMSMLPKLMEAGRIDTATNAWEEKQKVVNEYAAPALQIYFSRLGINPFEEMKHDRRNKGS